VSLPSALLGSAGAIQLIDPASHTLWPIVDQTSKDAVLRVLDRGVLSGPFAPESMAFQEEFASYVGAKHALLTHSGTSALVVALAAAGVGPGDEVIVPSYTFVATPLAVTACGARPLFADVDPTTGLLNPSEVRRWLTPRTKAIMPVHVHGCPVDLDELRAIAHDAGAVLVEDAAQAHGATYRGKPVGALAAGGAFSLQSSKNLGCGEGGIYVTNSAEQADLANSVRNFGQDLHLSEANLVPKGRPLDGWRGLASHRPGSMFRGNEMMAAFARAQLALLPARTARCQDAATYLAGAIRELPGLEPPHVPEDRTSVHHKYRIRIDQDRAGLAEFPVTRVRNALLAAMKATGFEVTTWERTTQTAQPVFANDASVTGLVKENYLAEFPATQQLLDSSLILFSQSCPLIAQTEEVVLAYAKALGRIWEHRRAIVESFAG
jgi:perosamine synthetase